MTETLIIDYDISANTRFFIVTSFISDPLRRNLPFASFQSDKHLLNLTRRRHQIPKLLTSHKATPTRPTSH
jgi:hypothetical protein